MITILKIWLKQILHGILDALLGIVLLPYIDRQIEHEHAERCQKLEQSLATGQRSDSSQRRLLNRIDRE